MSSRKKIKLNENSLSQAKKIFGNKGYLNGLIQVILGGSSKELDKPIDGATHQLKKGDLRIQYVKRGGVFSIFNVFNKKNHRDTDTSLNED